MHKYAAVTALAIALITTLALAVSASLTPANAGAIWCGGRYFHSGGSWPICLCLGAVQGRCGARQRHCGRRGASRNRDETAGMRSKMRERE
jgi:hypothetical protein